jgi:hypothetical protein
MKKVKLIAGITWVFLSLFLIIFLFMGFSNLSEAASKLPFMKLNPNYTGGEISHQIIEPNCTIDIRKPVFDGLIGERKKGFVQIEWRGKVPVEILDTIDYNSDKIPDFTIKINSNSSETLLKPMSDKVKSINVSTPTSYGWAIRVNLKR